MRPTSEGSGSRRQPVGNNDPVGSGDGSLESSARAGCSPRGGEGALCFMALLKPREPGYLNTVVFTVVFCVSGAGCPSRGQPLRLAVQFCTPPRGGSEPQRLEKSARSGSPHVAAALTLARPGGLRLRWLGAPRSRERKTSCRLRLRCQASWTDAG